MNKGWDYRGQGLVVKKGWADRGHQGLVVNIGWTDRGQGLVVTKGLADRGHGLVVNKG